MNLPEDVLIKILSYLDVRELLDFADTVPKLKNLLWHPKLWTNVDLQRVFCISDFLLELLKSNTSQVKCLAVTNPSSFFHIKLELQFAMTKMVNVTFLDLTMSNIIENMHFLVQMRSLQHAVLDCLSVLTADSFLTHLPQCTSLQTLSIKGNAFLSMFDVTAVCTNLVNLKFLDTQGTCDFTPSTVDEILSACPDMKTFLFNSFYYSRLYHQWVHLVNVKFPDVNFHYTTYQQVTRFKRKLRNHIEM